MSKALVGRDAESAQLRAWLADRAGQVPGAAAAAFVGGEAGVGKTALVRAAVAGEAEVRWAAAVPWHPAPYGLLGQLVPGIVRADRPSAVQPHVVRAALVDGGRPLVLVLDDLHWSDEATLELLAPLIDALAGDPVAVIGAYRLDELPRGHLLRRVRAQLRHRRQLAELTLGPLDAHALPALIASVVGGEPMPSLTAAVAERTEGLPFFVEELLAALGTAGWLISDGERIGLGPVADLPLPDSVRDAILLRVAGLPERSREQLDIAAVIGTEFDVATVAALAGDAWPDDLDHCGLIRAGAAGERQFRHALTQEAIYSEVPWSRRRTLHLALADRLSHTPAAAARHLLGGNDIHGARSALLAAADAHLNAHAYRDAARLLDTALDSWTPESDADDSLRLTAVDRLARCAELAGEHAAAITSLRELLDRRATIQPPLVRAELHRRLAIQYELLGHWPLALAARESAADGFAAADRPGESATERLAVAAHLRSAASFRAALDMLDAAEASAGAADRTDLMCRIAGQRGNVLARMGRAEAGVPIVRAALDRALSRGLAAPAAEIYQRLADSLEHAGDYRGATQAYDAAYEFCQTHEQDAAGQLCRACVTVVLFHGGRWDRALTHSGDVLADPTATPHARCVASGIAGLVHAMRGRATVARAALLDSRATAGRIDLVGMELLAVWGLALLDEAAGRLGRAAESYRHVVLRCRETEERHYCIPVLQFAVACFARDGELSARPAGEVVPDMSAATAILAEALAASGQPEARAAFMYALGESARTEGGLEQAVPQLRRAVDMLDGLDLPITDVLVRHRTGAALADAGRREEAAIMLRAAYRTAHRLKARPLVDRINADLDRVAEPPPGDRRAPSRQGDRRAPSSPAAGTLLSPRELEVLRLVADGLTGREIAQRLFLSVRTVEMHVRNGVAKLGCRTRAEAVRRLVTG